MPLYDLAVTTLPIGVSLFFVCRCYLLMLGDDSHTFLKQPNFFEEKSDENQQIALQFELYAK